MQPKNAAVEKEIQRSTVLETIEHAAKATTTSSTAEADLAQAHLRDLKLYDLLDDLKSDNKRLTAYQDLYTAGLERRMTYLESKFEKVEKLESKLAEFSEHSPSLASTSTRGLNTERGKT